MFKFKFDLDLDGIELESRLERGVKLATSASVADLSLKARELAASKLKNGLQHWVNGFHLEKVEDGDEVVWILGVDGKLANWKEDGIQVGEISKALLGSNKVKKGKNGKSYIDVPLALNADMVSKTVSYKKGQGDNQVKVKVEMSSFKNAHELVSQLGKGKTKTTKIQKAVDGIYKNIKTVKDSSGKVGETSVQFMAIRRVGQNSVWPKKPYPGVKVLDEIHGRLEALFDRNLNKYLERVL